jgi:hypothetical protein
MRNLHSFGLRGDLPIFIHNFISDRTIKVRVGNTISQSYDLHEGIPQGSVLSCTCFLIAINKITNAIQGNIQSCVYVDDLIIYASGGTTGFIERRLQTAINSIDTWASDTGFTLSPQKTVSIHICRKRGCPKMAPNLIINRNNIQCVTSKVSWSNI